MNSPDKITVWGEHSCPQTILEETGATQSRSPRGHQHTVPSLSASETSPMSPPPSYSVANSIGEVLVGRTIDIVLRSKVSFPGGSNAGGGSSTAGGTGVVMIIPKVPKTGRLSSYDDSLLSRNHSAFFDTLYGIEYGSCTEKN